MVDQKIKIEKKTVDINMKFYFMLKFLVKASLSEKNVDKFLEICSLSTPKNIDVFSEKFEERIDTKIPSSQKDTMYLILDRIETFVDVKIFVLSVHLCIIKNFLLQEAKLSSTLINSELQATHPLSLKYDTLSLNKPYSTRVNGALMSLLFFSKINKGETNFLSEFPETFVKEIVDEVKTLSKLGIQPNQIFMIIFSESINQSIISDSGSSYEDRILSVLTGLGIPKDSIKKTHDDADKSTEFDFFFNFEGKSYGIGAKRTLRERYKQFIKTGIMSKIDVMIEITLGIDLNEQKAKNILQHGVYIFVADEIYNSKEYLRKLDGVYSVKDLNLKTLKKLGNE